MGVCSRQRDGGHSVAGRAEKTQKEDGTWDRRRTRRCGDGATLRLPKQDVHDALTRYEFAAAAEGEDYVLSYRERGT